MSIESTYGLHTPICDGCGDMLEAAHDFHDAVNAKKAAGWRSVKEPWGWCDYCPACGREMNSAAADFKGVSSNACYFRYKNAPKPGQFSGRRF